MVCLGDRSSSFLRVFWARLDAVLWLSWLYYLPENILEGTFPQGSKTRNRAGEPRGSSPVSDLSGQPKVGVGPTFDSIEPIDIDTNSLLLISALVSKITVSIIAPISYFQYRVYPVTFRAAERRVRFSIIWISDTRRYPGYAVCFRLASKGHWDWK